MMYTPYGEGLRTVPYNDVRRRKKQSCTMM